VKITCSALPLTFAKGKQRTNFIVNDICAVKLRKIPQGFVDVLIPSQESSALSPDVIRICKLCYNCVVYDANLMVNMAFWFFDGDELVAYNPGSNSAYKLVLDLDVTTTEKLPRGTNFRVQNKGSTFQHVELEKCIGLMTEKNSVALIWTMFRTKDKNLVGWDTVVIVNPDFSAKGPAPLDGLFKLLNSDLVGPLIDLSPGPVEIVIVHDTGTPYKACCNGLNAIIDAYVTSKSKTNISLDRVQAYIIDGDATGLADSNLQHIAALEMAILTKGYRRIVPAIAAFGPPVTAGTHEAYFERLVTNPPGVGELMDIMDTFIKLFK
jgi:hypothetical protein